MLRLRRMEGHRFEEKPEEMEMRKAPMPKEDVELYKKYKIKKKKKEEEYKLPDLSGIKLIKVQK